MIELTRLNNNPIAINVDLIQWIEPVPDTTITLVTGEKLVVREDYKSVLSGVYDQRKTASVHPPLAASLGAQR